MPTQPQVALIEIGASHDECLHAQAAFLHHHGIGVHLILSDKVHQRAGTFDHVDHLHVVPEPAGPWGRFQAVRRILRYLRENQLRSVVLNTAHGKTIRNLCLLADKQIRFAGILHGAGKMLRPSFTQQIISSRVKTYFVLSDYIRDYVRQRNPSATLHSLYPVWLPGCDEPAQERTDDRLTVCIPGPVHPGRRDYGGLLWALANHPLRPDVHLVLLGKCPKQEYLNITQHLDALGLREQVTLFNRFVDQTEFRNHLAACDVVMPLVHPTTPNFANYRTVQITGSFNLAYAFRKPLLMHREFDDVEDFQRTACFYDEADLVQTLNHLAADRSALDRPQQNLRTWEKLQFNHQACGYIEALTKGGLLVQQPITPATNRSAA